MPRTSTDSEKQPAGVRRPPAGASYRPRPMPDEPTFDRHPDATQREVRSAPGRPQEH